MSNTQQQAMDVMDAAGAEIDRLRAEVERLRGALERLRLESQHFLENKRGVVHLVAALDAAVAALAPPAATKEAP